MMQIQERMRLAWPEGLAVPAEAPLTAWPYRLGDPDRYTHSWTAGNGYSWAQHADGAFLAAAYAPLDRERARSTPRQASGSSITRPVTGVSW